MSRLTRKINGEWDFSSIEGKTQSGLICYHCGEIVPLCYQQEAFNERYGYAICSFCPSCFTGDKEQALTCKVGM